MPFTTASQSIFLMPKQEHSDRPFSRYFDFATPSYRFLHRPTIEKWATELLESSDTGEYHDSKSLTPAKKAAVFLVWLKPLSIMASRAQVKYRGTLLIFFRKLQELTA
jgi:hypothetical protein